MCVQLAALYYLKHARALAATAQGKRATGSGPLSGRIPNASAAAMNDVLVLFAVLLGMWSRVALYCIVAMMMQAVCQRLGLPLSWNVCFAVQSGTPLQLLAATAAWEGSVVGRVVLLLLACRVHVDLEHCRWLSVACVCCLPGSNSLGGLIAAAAAYYDPAFPKKARLSADSVKDSKAKPARPQSADGNASPTIRKVDFEHNLRRKLEAKAKTDPQYVDHGINNVMEEVFAEQKND